ncbi:uncharacterized protein [Battus philenor]|uniref:uncharacterized protein isoform X1 n=1 Tax=Battus philenor TaxID=42288 RepID=UPI0035D0A040
MMRIGRIVLAIAAVLVCSSANPHRESEAGVSDHNSDRFDISDYKQREFDYLLRLLLQNEKRHGERNINGIGGSTLLGRNINGGLGGSSMVGRNLNGYETNSEGNFDSALLGRNFQKNLHGIGGSTILGREVEEQSNLYTRVVDPLGGSNFVRNLDSLGGGNFVRNLDSLGGSNFVKKNLDQIGGPNFIKRNLDSLGGGNFVRNLDPLGGDNLVRALQGDENIF